MKTFFEKRLSLLFKPLIDRNKNLVQKAASAIASAFHLPKITFLAAGARLFIKLIHLRMQFSDNSRVWIYQATRELTDAETKAIEQQLCEFTQQWTAHNQQLSATGEVRYNRFLILIVDEEQAGASGCSIDKSVHFMQFIEREYQIQLFDRFNLAYRTPEGIKSATREEFENMVAQGKITADTVVFNNLANNLAQLNNNWEVPLSQSWHARVFSV